MIVMQLQVEGLSSREVEVLERSKVGVQGFVFLHFGGYNHFTDLIIDQER
jgi:hypothetical protein